MESRVPSPKFKWCLCLRHPFGFNNLLYLRQTQFPERCTDKRCPGIYRCNFSRFDVEWSRSTWNEIQLENISAFFEKYENRLCRTLFTGFPVFNEVIVDLCTVQSKMQLYNPALALAGRPRKDFLGQTLVTCQIYRPIAIYQISKSVADQLNPWNNG